MPVFIFAMLFVGVTVSYAQVGGDDVAARRAALEAELADIEKEIVVQQELLGAKQGERVSLERDIAILDAEIERARLSIRARNLIIARLEEDIVGKKETIVGLDEKLEREKESLSQLIRKTNEIDHFSLIEIMLSNQNLSDFLGDLDSFDTITIALQDSFKDIAETKGITEDQKKSLEEKRTEEVELRFIQELEKKKIEVQEDEKQRILKVTKGIESAYQTIIKSKEKTAAQIRTELFTLRGSAAIPFEQALNYANAASAKTGVRPALILGVIAEESNLGENVGTGSWLSDMHPERDRPLFAEIARSLGLDPNQLPVSKKPWYGWGGAMGPAQFIPSTWVLYAGYACTKAPVTCSYTASKDRIGKASGEQPPNPWSPRTAFMASAILLMDNGADRGTYAAERLAALRYFAGWKNAEKATYAFYGDEVMGLAAKYQGLINILAGS